MLGLPLLWEGKRVDPSLGSVGPLRSRLSARPPHPQAGEDVWGLPLLREGKRVEPSLGSVGPLRSRLSARPPPPRAGEDVLDLPLLREGVRRLVLYSASSWTISTGVRSSAGVKSNTRE